MLVEFIYYCRLIKWFIIGGIKPINSTKKNRSSNSKLLKANWSKAEYQMHFRNAASNLGMLSEARRMWEEKPLEYRKKKEEGWKKRYGKDWRKYVLI